MLRFFGLSGLWLLEQEFGNMLAQLLVCVADVLV